MYLYTGTNLVSKSKTVISKLYLQVNIRLLVITIISQ